MPTDLVVNKQWLCHIFLAVLFIGGLLDPTLGAEKRSRTDYEAVPSESSSLCRKLFTPDRTRERTSFHISPSSQDRKFAIYLIHDAYGLKFKQIDFEGKVISPDSFVEKTLDLRLQIQRLRSARELHSFHRYIGLVSTKTNPDRTVRSRFHEHATACNSIGKTAEKRLCLGLKYNSKHRIKNNMTVIAYDIHPSQIFAIEAHFIQLFGGLEDLGWNSNPGNLGAKIRFDESDSDDESAEALAEPLDVPEGRA